MRRVSAEEPLLQSARRLRLVLQCRERTEVSLCEHLAFAFARDAGLRGPDVWYVAACATVLATHGVDSGGGELELRVIESPKPAVELRLRHEGAIPPDAAARVRTAREYVSEMITEWCAGVGTVIIARKWLHAD
jgi:hypothetical protein